MNEPTMTIDNFGNKRWFLNDELHREDGPAIEYKDGTKSWHLNGKLHREDGPAVEYADGTKSWYVRGTRHREDGPSFENVNGTKSWHLDDKQLSESEFRIQMRIIKLKKMGL